MRFTKKQLEIMEFISTFQRDHHISPTLEEIAEHMGVCKITVYEHIEALKKKGAIAKQKHFARSIEILDPEFSLNRLELVGRIAAGKPIEAIEDKQVFEIKDLIPKGGNHYVLRVKGNSMIEEGIRDGDYVIVEKAETAHNGQTVVAIIGDNEATLKKFFREGSRIRLEPANSEMKPIVVRDCEIRGIVRGVVRKY